MNAHEIEQVVFLCDQYICYVWRPAKLYWGIYFVSLGMGWIILGWTEYNKFFLLLLLVSLYL